MITFKDQKHRNLVVEQLTGEPPVLGGIRVDVKPHMEKQPDGSKVEVPDCAFAGWKQAKEPGACNLQAGVLRAYLDRLCDRMCPVIALDP